MTPDELRALADEATPGPWKANGISIFEPQGSLVADVMTWNEKIEFADARLISLAPDLARLCAEMAEALEDYRSGSADHYLAKLSELKL